uniref:Uncharacterized protein n=1 Tax=Cucumis sativus TaxID=3659 RepID=A0A0A0L792_CUCSA
MQRWHGRAPVPDAYGRVNGHLGLPLGYLKGKENKGKKKALIQWTQARHHVATWLLLFGASASKSHHFLSLSSYFSLLLSCLSPFLPCATLFCPDSSIFYLIAGLDGMQLQYKECDCSGWTYRNNQ